MEKHRLRAVFLGMWLAFAVTSTTAWAQPSETGAANVSRAELEQLFGSRTFIMDRLHVAPRCQQRELLRAA